MMQWLRVFLSLRFGLFVLLIGFGVTTTEAKSTAVAKSAAPAKPATEQEKTELRAMLDGLIKAAGDNRTATSAGNKRAYAWLRERAAKIKGWEIEDQEFTPNVDFALQENNGDFKIFEKIEKESAQYQHAKRMHDVLARYYESMRGKKGKNLILRKKGTNAARAKELFVVSAHYDTMISREKPFDLMPNAPAPGADDNGAAVVTLLRLAERLADLKPARTVELVFFDFEEEFFLGSHAYGTALYTQGRQVDNLNLEMIGWDRIQPNEARLYTRSEGHPGWDRDGAIADAAFPFLKREGGLSIVVERDNFGRSDNWSFWRTFHASTTLSQDWHHGFNRYNYHTSHDTPDSLNWDFIARIGRGLEPAVRALAR